MKVSNSRIQCFKSCRRMYELKYLHGLEPVEQSQAIQRGLSYHDGVEDLLKEWIDYKHERRIIDDYKVAAMVAAFNRYLIPALMHRCAKPTDAEKWFSYETKSGHKVFGRFDGLMTGHTPIEHKTTSGLIDGAYLMRIDLDEQVNTYLLASGSKKMFYTVCATPTLKVKKDENPNAFMGRCLNWYEEDTEHKIALFDVVRSDEQLEEFAAEQDAVITEMENCKLFYRNTNHCMKWGKLCPYAPVCMSYDPEQEYIQFKSKRGRESNGVQKIGGGS